MKLFIFNIICLISLLVFGLMDPNIEDFDPQTFVGVLVIVIFIGLMLLPIGLHRVLHYKKKPKKKIDNVSDIGKRR